MHKAPARALAFRRTGAPRGHARETYAILDNREQLAIRQLLGCRGTHVGGGRVEAVTHLRVTPAVVAMTPGTVICEVRQCVLQDLMCQVHGIRPRSDRTRHGEVAHGARDRPLYRARFYTCAHASAENS